MRSISSRPLLTGALTLLVAVTVPSMAHSKLIPYFRMDSLAFQADLVVLCKEQGYAPPHDAPIDTNLTHRTGTFVVQQTFKGEMAVGKTLTARIAGTYRRALLGDGIPTYGRQKDGRTVSTPVRSFPLGQVLLFLKWNAAEKIYEPVMGGIKVITDGKVLAFGQFVSNPGPMVLAPMKPENVTVSSYGLAELLADLALGLEKAKQLKAPIGGAPEYLKE
jgi:hypothetical protein